MVLGPGMRHDASQIRIVNMHLWVSGWHDGRPSKAVTQLRGKLKFFQIRRARKMLLRRPRLISRYGFGNVIMKLDIVG